MRATRHAASRRPARRNTVLGGLGGSAKPIGFATVQPLAIAVEAVAKRAETPRPPLGKLDTAGGVSIVRGTLDILVLKALSWGPMHGPEIIVWLEDRSGGRLALDDSALLQAFHRLEERGLLDSAWGTTANNRRARYYRLTAKDARN